MKKILMILIVLISFTYFYLAPVNGAMIQTKNDPFAYYEDLEYTLIDSGNHHSIAVTKDNRVFTWGKSYHGELGDGNNKDSYIFLEITESFEFNNYDSIVEVSADGYNTGLLTSTGDFYIWGANYYGQIGDGTYDSKLRPVLINEEIDLGVNEIIVDINIGSSFTIVLTNQGTIYTWGSNRFGQLGTDIEEQSNEPINITNRFNLDSTEQLIDVSLGGGTVFAISNIGNVYAWGDNRYSQLGDGTDITKSNPTNISSNFDLSVGESIIKVVTGGDHSAALSSLGNLYTWGSNNNGQLCNDNETNASTPQNIAFQFPFTNGDFIKDISLGGLHSGFITNQGSVYTCGQNYYSQLGVQNLSNTSSPIDISLNFPIGTTITSISFGQMHSLALDSANTIYSWGGNDQYQLGYEGANRSLPNDIGANYIGVKPPNMFTDKVEYMATGYSHSLAKTLNNKLYAWGYNGTGQIGNNLYDTVELVPVDITENLQLEVGEIIEYMTTGTYHSGITTSNNRVLMWGGNKRSQLGNNSKESSALPVDITSYFSFGTNEGVVDFESGYFHSLLLTDAGNLFSWGKNEYGTLGDGTTNETLVPVNITSYFNLENGEMINDVETGDYYNIAVTSLGRIFTWGQNENGELGNGTFEDSLTPLDITSNLNLDDGESFTNLSAHSGSVIISTSDNRVFVWGNNNYYNLSHHIANDMITLPYEITGELDLQYQENIEYIENGYNSSVLITSFGRVLSLGKTYSNIVSDINMSSNGNVDRLYIGSNFQFAKTSEGELYAWGNNSYGALGNGTTIDNDIPSKINDMINSDSLKLAYAEQEQPNTSSTIMLSIFFSNILTNSIHSVEIDDKVIMPEDLIYENGRLDVYIDNVWTIGDEVDLTFNSITFVGGRTIHFDTNNRLKTTIILDETPPTFDHIETQNIEVSTNDIDWSSYILNRKDNGNGVLTASEVEDTVIYNSLGEYSVTVKLFDEAYNETYQIFRVVVRDTTAPVITLSGDEGEIVEVGEDYAQVDGTCTDNYDEACIVTMQGLVDTSQVGEYTTVYTATDESGNTTIIARTVSVVDTTAPVITLSGDERDTVELGEDYVQVGGTCTDNYDDVCTVTMQGVVDTSQVGEFTTVYTATDESENTTTITRTVTVVDTTPPELTLNPMDSTVPINAVLEETGVTIHELSDTTMIIDSDLDLTTAGTYTVTYTVTDNSGNSSAIERIIHVYEPEPEVQFHLEDALTTIEVGAMYEDPGCTATINGETFNCSLAETLVDTANAGVYTIIYSVDYNGETYTHNRYLFVYDVNDNGVQTLYYRKEQEEGVIL